MSVGKPVVSAPVSNDTHTTEALGKGIGVLLATVDNAYWLLEGEEHLPDLLEGLKTYPTPVHCLRFSTSGELEALLPADEPIGTLWNIHPAIAERLKQQGELEFLDGSELTEPLLEKD